MSQVRMPVLVRLLTCAALVGVLSASTMPTDDASAQGGSSSEHLPTTNSLSGYIIAVG